MKRRLAPLAALLAAALAAGCSSDPETNTPPDPCEGKTVEGGLPLLGADCDPLVPTQCGFPFPSNVWLQDDATTVTGKHVVFGAATLPKPTNGKPIDPLLVAGSDGFSPGQTIITHLPAPPPPACPRRTTSTPPSASTRPPSSSTPRRASASRTSPRSTWASSTRPTRSAPS
jgi:hypothetical protein